MAASGLEPRIGWKTVDWRGWYKVASPHILTMPALTGTPTDGETLTASDGTWEQTLDSTTYQWYADGVAIAGATSSTYELQVGSGVGEFPVGTKIKCFVSGHYESRSRSYWTNTLVVA
jgi:hypothetical protein